MEKYLFAVPFKPANESRNKKAEFPIVFVDQDTWTREIVIQDGNIESFDSQGSFMTLNYNNARPFRVHYIET
jgi:hypothetical protein